MGNLHDPTNFGTIFALFALRAQEDINSLYDTAIRFHPDASLAQQLIEKGTLGDVEDNWFYPDASLAQQLIEKGALGDIEDNWFYLSASLPCILIQKGA